jgi:cystathionine beta-lyase/cystathionine gamma-synthase
LLEQPHIDPADDLICLGHGEDTETTAGSMTPSIVQTSLFAKPTLDALMAALSAEHRSNVYTRGQNPTVEAVERKLARLERGEAAKCMASGMGAISAALFGLLEAGSHVLFVNQTYGPTLQLADRLEAYGVEHDLLLELDMASIEAAMRPNTRIVWLESPGTMTFRMVDVGSVAALARRRGALSVIDNSWATPLFQKPLTRGVDLVIHTASKYIGGHSDVMAGAVVGSAELLERIFYDGFLLLGAALGPVDAWLVNRGLRTLPARMRQHHATGLAVARFLQQHPRVRRVFHPALTAEASLVDSQLTGFSGLLSFELDSDRYDDVATVVDRLGLFRIGVSWGGVESVVISPNRGDNIETLAAQGIPPGTIRLSLGLEGSEALIADLDQALGSRGPA